jgi:hypothetical protein
MIKSLSTFPSIILFVFYISVNILAQNSSQQIPSGLVGH